MRKLRNLMRKSKKFDAQIKKLGTQKFKSLCAKKKWGDAKK